MLRSIASARRRIAALGLLVAVAAAPGVHASGLDLFGLGARGEALTGGVIATAGGFEATYYNPAGLAFDESLTFALGYHSATFDLHANGDAISALDAPVVTIGFGVPIPFGGALADRFTLGVAFLLPQKSVLITDIEAPGERTFLLVENRAQTVSILGALGVRITDWLSVGVGALALAELFGAIDVAPTASGALGTSVRDELVATWSFIAGVMVKPTPWLSAGLVYRGESRADFQLPVTADLGDGFNIPLPKLDIRGTAHFDPTEVALEVAVTPIDPLLISLGLTWQRWSTFDNPIEYLAVPADFPAQLPPNFSDTWRPHLAVEATLQATPDFTVVPRLGLAFEPTPVPEQTGLHNHLDSDRLIVGLGASLRYGPARLDLVGQVHRLFERTSTKDPALVPDPDANPGAPSITYDGTVFFGGLELGIEL